MKFPKKWITRQEARKLFPNLTSKQLNNVINFGKDKKILDTKKM